MIEIVESKKGLKVKKINGFLTHSLYDPYKEALKFVEKHIEDVQIHIIYGYGSGYIIDEFIKNNTFNTTYIVLDPFINISNLDDSEYVKYIYLKDIKEVEKIYKYLADLSNNIKITCSLNYDKISPNMYSELLKKIKNFLEISKVNENTVLSASYLWFRNYLLNLKYEDNSVINLEKVSKKGVIIASGGPSLTKQLPILKRYRDKFIVISAGSTTNSLVQEGITPDIVVSVDGHILNYKHFEHLYFNDETLFVYSMYSYPKIREHFKKAYYFVDSSGMLIGEKLSSIKNEESAMFSGGGSVAHYALILGIYISSGPICLIGQDLAYLNGQTHAKNNMLGKILTLEQREKLIEIEGYYGETVYTDNSLLGMKKSFERIAKSIKNERDIFNCTEGGALIEGLINKPFESFCEQFQNLNETVNFKNIETQKVQKEPLEVSKELLKQYKKIDKIICENLKMIQHTKKIKVFTSKILKKLEKNDEFIKKMSDKDAVSVAFQATAIKVQRNFKRDIHDTEIDKFNKAIEENLFLYSEMRDIIKFGIRALEDNIRELEV